VYVLIEIHWRATAMNRISRTVEKVLRTAPRWVTPELVRETIEVLEPCYGRELTAEEIREIIVNVGRFVDVAKEMELNETVRGIGESEQS